MDRLFAEQKLFRPVRTRLWDPGLQLRMRLPATVCVGLEERAAELGGSMEIETPSGGGMVLRIFCLLSMRQIARQEQWISQRFASWRWMTRSCA